MARESIRIEGLEAVVKTLRQLGPEMSKNGGPVRIALRKAAQVIQKKAQENVRKIVLEPNKDGRPSKSTGELERSIIVKRGRAPQGQKGETALVTIKPGGKRRYANNKKNRRSGRAGKTYEVPPPAFYGWFLERGTERMRAHPWFRPAVDATKVQVLQTFALELPRAIVALQKKLAKTNGAKT
jgi:HK97 gp10 family phage protein